MDVFTLFCSGLTILIGWRFCWADFKRVVLPKLLNEKSFQHLTFAVIFILFLLWRTQAGIKDGLQVHFLALTTLTMMFGWRMAFLICLPVTFGLALTSDMPLSAIPEYLTLSVLFPVAISYLIFCLSYHYLPRNIFVFIFIAGFLNAAITGSLHLMVNALYHLWSGHYDWQTIWDNYFILVPLLAFPEALLNGMSLAVLCVFKPEWLRVFSDHDYIFNHYHKH